MIFPFDKYRWISGITAIHPRKNCCANLCDCSQSVCSEWLKCSANDDILWKCKPCASNKNTAHAHNGGELHEHTDMHAKTYNKSKAVAQVFGSMPSPICSLATFWNGFIAICMCFLLSFFLSFWECIKCTFLCCLNVNIRAIDMCACRCVCSFIPPFRKSLHCILTVDNIQKWIFISIISSCFTHAWLKNAMSIVWH